MDGDNLKFFLALAETGSLSRASDKLRVDHSTVARRIEMLEQDLGVRLVERLSRSYRLTAEGERVRDRAKEIEAGISAIAPLSQSVDPSPHPAVLGTAAAARVGAGGASWTRGARLPRLVWSSVTDAPCTERYTLSLRPALRIFPRRPRGDRPHHCNPAGGERSISWGV